MSEPQVTEGLPASALTVDNTGGSGHSELIKTRSSVPVLRRAVTAAVVAAANARDKATKLAAQAEQAMAAVQVADQAELDAKASLAEAERRLNELENGNGVG